MSKGNSVTIPSYNKPNASSFSMFGNTASKNGDNWNYSTSGIDASTMNQAKQIRKQLIGSLGLSQGDEANSQYYQNVYNKDLLRSSQPQLENALIGRGLGGSSVYSNALTDLISKAATQSVLGRQQYQSNEQNYNLNNLTALQNYLQGEQQTGNNLLSLASNYDLYNQRLAQNLYETQLPYLSTVNKGTDYSGLLNLAGGLLNTVSGGGAGNLLSLLSKSSLGGGSLNTGAGGGANLDTLLAMINNSSLS